MLRCPLRAQRTKRIEDGTCLEVSARRDYRCRPYGFSGRGFEGGIFEEIIKEAKIAKGTVYLYFRSRSEAYKAVFDHDMKALKQSCWLRTAIPCTTKLRFFFAILLGGTNQFAE